MSSSFLDITHHLDKLSIIMMVLVAYIGTCVTVFASRYMNGDAKFRSFLSRLIALIFLVGIMVSSDNLWLLLISLCASNLVLVSLMIHKSKWRAAKISGLIAAKNYLLSTVAMASAFVIFYLSTGQSTISAIVTHSNNATAISVALLLLLIAAMAQSAIWPFHKWLISSLNSPTPVSAIMHAGVVNSGGFLLARFASLYSQNETIMNLIFIFGISSALLGTLWKLMQSDVKRMLACSTMAQMGFMFVQCGLGLFPLAIAHLFWHGLFKAYLFLASGSAGQEKRLDICYRPTALAFACSLVCGTLGSLMFAYASNKSWLAGDSTLVLMVIVFLAGSQISLTILRAPSFKNFILACIVTPTAALLYGCSAKFIIWILGQMGLMHPQPLNFFHIMGIFVLILAWLFIVFIRNPSKNISRPRTWMLHAYVKALNSSQPHQDTITSHRNHYQY